MRLVLCHTQQQERNNDTIDHGSSNCLLDAMQIGTDCIYLSNLHYEFSNVSSKRSDQSRRHGIVCIDLTYLHCVSSNVISHIFCEQRKTHTDCSCLTFSIVRFQVLSQVACFKECIITLAGSGFSPLRVLIHMFL